MKRPDLAIPTYEAAQFKPWTGKKGVAFISDLNLGSLPLHKQVWSDACDSGFWMKGNGPEPKLFTLTATDDKSDTRSWTFRSQDGFEVVVFNT